MLGAAHRQCQAKKEVNVGRHYKRNGLKYPSVTTITGQLDKPALTWWAANCACDYIISELEGSDEDMVPVGALYPVIEAARKGFMKVSRQALDIGSATHGAIEHYLKTGQEPQAPSDEVLSAFLAFLEWKGSMDVGETIQTEFTLYADRYAGTCDWIVMLGGKKYLIDFKASKGIYKEYQYQVAAYRACDPSIEGCGILRLDKVTGLPEWKDTSETYEQDLKVFEILTDLWYATHPREAAAHAAAA